MNKLAIRTLTAMMAALNVTSSQASDNEQLAAVQEFAQRSLQAIWIVWQMVPHMKSRLVCLLWLFK